MRFEVVEDAPHQLGGLATRKQIRIHFGDDDHAPVLNVLLYVPHGRGAKRYPTFLGLNFYGNHTVHADPGIALAVGWIHDSAPGVVTMLVGDDDAPDPSAVEAGAIGALAERLDAESRIDQQSAFR